MKRSIRKFLAVILAVTLTAMECSIGLFSAMADRKTDAVFEIQGEELLKLAQEAVEDAYALTEKDFSFTDGETEAFSDFFFENDTKKLYEICLETESAVKDVELHIFIRVPCDADSTYELTGKEELLFLFVNEREDTVRCSAKIGSCRGEKETFLTTRRITMKSFDEAFGDGSEDSEFYDASRSDATPSGAARSVVFTSTPSDAAMSSDMASPPDAAATGATPADNRPVVSVLVGMDGCTTARAYRTSLSLLHLMEVKKTNTEQRTWSYEDELVSAEVKLPGNTKVPEEADLYVEPITPEHEDYEAFCGQTREVIGEEVFMAALYDIGFEIQGEHLEVSDKAEVSFRMKNAPLMTDQPDQVQVVHFADDGLELPVPTKVEMEEERITEVSFSMNGFSVIALAASGRGMTYYERHTAASVDELAGTWLIVNTNNGSNNYLLTADTVSGQSGKLASAAPTASADRAYLFGDGWCEWTFVRAGSGSYYIYTIVNGNRQYLNISGTSISTSANRQVLYVEVNAAGQVELYSNGYCVNRYGSTNYFGGWYTGNDGNNYQTLYRASETSGSMLFYSLTLPAYTSSGSWADGEVALPGDLQEITESETPLFEVSGKNETVGRYIFVPNLSDSSGSSQLSRAYKEIQELYENNGLPYGREFLFRGWSTMDAEGNTVLISAEATVCSTEDGIQVKEPDGTKYLLPDGSTLTGIWQQYSDIVTFYVNYTGTVLDTEGDVAGRNTSDFTDMVAAGHVYYGSTTVGSDSSFATEVNQEIVSCIGDGTHIPDGATHIVVDMLVTTKPEEAEEGDQIITLGSSQRPYFFRKNGFNEDAVEERVLTFIHDKPLSIKVITGRDSNGNNTYITLDANTVDAYHFSMRWYVLKPQQDGWHIDGVVVAKTVEMTVTKTFEGLSDTEISNLLNGNFSIDVIQQNSGSTYLRLRKASEENGVVTDIEGNHVTGKYTYSYDSQTKTAIWKVRCFPGELFTIQESGYTVSGKSCSTAIVVDNDTSSTRYDNTITEEIGYAADRTVSFYDVYIDNPVFSVKKVDNEGKPLQGAEFTLTYGTSYSQSRITDENGLATFTGLSAGSGTGLMVTRNYTLRETQAPDGYSTTSALPLTVKVTRQRYGSKGSYYYRYTVSVNDQSGVYYENSGYVIIPYEIVNEPAPDTIIVEKYFSGDTEFSSGDIENLKDSYQIRVSGDGEEHILTLKNANSVSANGYKYTWRIPKLTAGRTYVVSESGYDLGGYGKYPVCTITASQKHGLTGTAERIEVSVNAAEKTASVTLEKSGEVDVLSITNQYSSQYALQVDKVSDDPGSSKIHLAGAVFELYGPFGETVNSAKAYDYIDGSGERKRYYYIGRIGPTDEHGLTELSGMIKYGSEYLLVETITPKGYQNKGPVTIRAENYNIINGVLLLEIVNSRGVMLPSTGGMGISIFIFTGFCMTAGAGLLYIEKELKRKRRKA